MKAVDTNIVVRLLAGDDVRQEAAARAVFAAGAVWIAKTVLLETYWVLRHLYDFEEGAIRDAFVSLLALPAVHAEDPESLTKALALMAHGIDFADALHVSSRSPATELVSFDKAFVNRARRAGLLHVSMLPAGPG